MKNNYTTIDVTQPKDGYTVRTNYYWLCVNGDPTKALFYKKLYPQCNKNKYISEKHGIKELNGETVSVIFIPVAYIKEIQ